MKKPLLKQIRATAARLPVQTTAARLPVQTTEAELILSGQQIIDARIKKAHATGKRYIPMEDSAGNEIDPNRYYSTPVDMQVNHARRIKKAFQRGGTKAVEEYIQQVIDLYTDAKAGHINMMASLPAQPMSV